MSSIIASLAAIIGVVLGSVLTYLFHQRRKPDRDRRGMRAPERREVMCLLGSMQRFEVSEQVAWRAATLMREYRRSHTGIGLGDYLIAATALTEGLELATLNVRHYPMFPGLARPFPT